MMHAVCGKFTIGSRSLCRHMQSIVSGILHITVRLSFQGIFVRSVGDVAETSVAAASSVSRHIADRRQPRSVVSVDLSCIVTIG